MIDRVLLAPVLRRGVGDGCSNHHKNFCIVVHPDDRGDRVGLTGLRPSALPHHRTCGFPHPAVEPGDLKGRKI